jgi:hypothetical protein
MRLRPVKKSDGDTPEKVDPRVLRIAAAIGRQMARERIAARAAGLDASDRPKKSN